MVDFLFELFCGPGGDGEGASHTVYSDKYKVDTNRHGILGSGAFGVVRKCQNRSTSESFAIKSIQRKRVAKPAMLKREVGPPAILASASTALARHAARFPPARRSPSCSASAPRQRVGRRRPRLRRSRPLPRAFRSQPRSRRPRSRSSCARRHPPSAKTTPPCRSSRSKTGTGGAD